MFIRHSTGEIHWMHEDEPSSQRVVPRWLTVSTITAPILARTYPPDGPGAPANRTRTSREPVTCSLKVHACLVPVGTTTCLRRAGANNSDRLLPSFSQFLRQKKSLDRSRSMARSSCRNVVSQKNYPCIFSGLSFARERNSKCKHETWKAAEKIQEGSRRSKKLLFARLGRVKKKSRIAITIGRRIFSWNGRREDSS